MTDTTLTAEFNYDPDRLLDALIKKLNLKNDAALSRALAVAPPVISKIRHRRLPVGASILVRMHEESALSIRALRGSDRNGFTGKGCCHRRRVSCVKVCGHRLLCGGKDHS